MTTTPTTSSDLTWHASGSVMVARIGVATITAPSDAGPFWVDADGRTDSRFFDSLEDAFADAIDADAEAQR